jgi:hypothetical protein
MNKETIKSFTEAKTEQESRRIAEKAGLRILTCAPLVNGGGRDYGRRCAILVSRNNRQVAQSKCWAFQRA